MPPIRVALIGLSGASADKYSGVNWAAGAHLPYLMSSSHYVLAGMLNTSLQSSQEAIAKHNLPASTIAYASPEELAADSTIDLVVVCTRVDRHFAPIRPSIIAGKTIFIEWPLERNLATIHSMASLAAIHNAKTIVGLQGSFSPAARKMKAMMDEGKLGIVLSSTAFGSLGWAGVTESKDVGYFLDRGVGGNAVSIHMGHAVEVFSSVLGEFKSFDSLLAIRLPAKDIVDADGTVIRDLASNTVPDQHMLQATTLIGVTFSYHQRGGPFLPGTPALEWRIQGALGELRLLSPSSALNVGHPGTKIEFFDAGSGEVSVVEAEKDEMDELPVRARNIGRLYKAYWMGEWVSDMEWVIKRHEMLGEMWRRFDAGVGG